MLTQHFVNLQDHIEWSYVESVMFLKQRPELYSSLTMPNFTKREKLNFNFTDNPSQNMLRQIGTCDSFG